MRIGLKNMPGRYVADVTYNAIHQAWAVDLFKWENGHWAEIPQINVLHESQLDAVEYACSLTWQQVPTGVN